MPEYDPTNYPGNMTNDLTSAEVGRDTPPVDPAAWPSSNLLPSTYAGPPPAREYDAGMPSHGDGNLLRGRSVQPPATTDASAVLPSVVPPPGHE